MKYNNLENSDSSFFSDLYNNTLDNMNKIYDGYDSSEIKKPIIKSRKNNLKKKKCKNSDSSYFLDKDSKITCTSTVPCNKKLKKMNYTDSDKSYFLEKDSNISCTSTVPCRSKKCSNVIHIPIYYPNNYWYKVKC